MKWMKKKLKEEEEDQETGRKICALKIVKSFKTSILTT